MSKFSNRKILAQVVAYKTCKLKIYRDLDNKWRWRLVGRNGRTVAASSQGYARRSTAINNFYQLAFINLYKVEGFDFR